MSAKFRRVWLADLLGGLGYSGQCFTCGRQFMSRNVYVWLCLRTGVKYCSEVCTHGTH